MSYTAERLKLCIGHNARWEKYNLKTGTVDTLQGEILDVGNLPNCGNTEYVHITDGAGKQFLTIPLQIKEVL